jgi:hypothetical protein
MASDVGIILCCRSYNGIVLTAYLMKRIFLHGKLRHAERSGWNAFE